MDSTQSDTSGGERRLSTAASVRTTGQASHHTDDSLYLEDIPVADGFRPSHTTEPAPQTETSTSRPGSTHEPLPPLLLSPLALLAPSPRTAADTPTSLPDTNETSPNVVAPPDVTTKGNPGLNPGPSIPRPSSTSKQHRPHDTFALRNDGSSTTFGNSFHTSQTNDSSLSNSDHLYLGTPTTSTPQFGLLGEGSRTGATNPSSPMGEGQYNGPRGPTHPYALYPQNTVPGDELSNQHIPIGFPGHAVTYQRQVGPDGEELGDLVGPMGHMEELPPYTRYPDPALVRRDGFGTSSSSNPGTAGDHTPGPSTSPSVSPSVSAVADTSTDHSTDPTANTTSNPSTTAADSSSGRASIGATVRTSVAGSSNSRNSLPPPPEWQAEAGGIGLATRNPEYSPTEGSLAPVHGSNQSVQTGESVDTAQSFNVVAKDFAEKIVPGGKWHRRARKKLWGVIPYWAICLMVTCMIVIGIVLGAVVGTILTNDSKKDSLEYPYGEVPTPADVEPLGTLPQSLPPLATGPFDLPPLEVSQSPRMCFNDTTQSQAWNCDMPLRWYSMHVQRIPNASETENYEMSLTSVNGSNNMYLWGTQPPSIVEPVSLMLVNDTFEVSRGPAWWFKMNYNKQVLLSENSFTSFQKRDWDYDGPPRPGFDPTRFMTKNPGPEDGEKPWFCTWPNTTMEVFIYPSQNISVRYTSATSTSSSVAGEATAAADDDTTLVSPYDTTPAYPQVIKFMERRLFMDGDEEAATCRQVKITNGGRDKEDLYDDDGDPIEVIVVEKMRTYEELAEAANRNRHPDRRWMRNLEMSLVKRESLELTDCGCLWWST